jgi:hypothetical protein
VRSLRYLNSVLTILAVLLTLNLWTLWTTAERVGGALPEFASTASAGIPNAGLQRYETNSLLKSLNQKTEELTGLFRSGAARIRMEQPARDRETKPAVAKK